VRHLQHEVGAQVPVVGGHVAGRVNGKAGEVDAGGAGGVAEREEIADVRGVV
jgi:hypothetical protein